MKKLYTLTLVMLALLLVAGLGACKSSDSDDNRDGGAAQTPSDGEEDTTPSAGETPDDGEDDGDSASGDPEAYFRALEAIGIRTDAGLEAVSTEISNAVFTTDQEEIDGVRGALQETGEILEQALLDVEALEPPADVQSQHDAFFDALLDVTVTTADALQAIENVTTSAVLNDTLATFDPQLTAGDAAFDTACFALQDLSDGSGFNFDMQCGDD
jgi:hypothetical protein